MKVITVSKDSVINNTFYRKGEIVQVEDSYSVNIQNTLVSTKEIKEMNRKNKQEVDRIKNNVKTK